MINQVFSVFDTKAKAYMQPFMLPTVGMAIRAFSDSINKEGTEANLHPHDYQLFHLGNFDDQTAHYELFEGPKHLANGNEHKIDKGIQLNGVQNSENDTNS